MLAFAVALVAMAVTFAIEWGGPVLAPFLIGVAFCHDGIADRFGRTHTAFPRLPFSVSLRRFFGLPRSAIGTAVAHFGLGMCLLGVACEANYGAERILSLKPGQTVSVRGYDLTFDESDLAAGPELPRTDRQVLQCDQAAMRSVCWNRPSAPSRRGNSSTTEAALLTRGFSQIYLSLGDVGCRWFALRCVSIISRWCC